YGFIVQQTVYRPGIGLVIPGVGLTHKPGAPFGNNNGKYDIHHDSENNGKDIAGAERDQQNACYHQDFQQGRNNVEQGKAQQEADTGSATFDVPGQPAGFPVQVEGQLTVMQMAEYPQRDPPHGTL